MPTLKIVPAPPVEGSDLRDFPLKLRLGGRPLDLMPECRFDEVRDDALLFELLATAPAEAGVHAIRKEAAQRTAVARPFFIPRNMPTEGVLELIRARGGRSANALEFLAFAAQYPEFQRGAQVVTLGWSCQEGRWTKYPMLTADVRQRRILRSVCPPSWPKDWRYLIILS